MKSTHVLFGEETYLLQSKKDEIIKSNLSAEETILNVSVHDARETSIQEVIDDCQMMSFLGGKRVIVVKDCYFLTTEKVKEKIEHDIDRLQSYLESPNEETVLILMVPYEKMEGRKKVVKNMKKLAAVYEGKPLASYKLFDWIISFTKREGILISNEAINVLINYVGSNLFQLEQELRKMALYIGKENELQKEDVESLVSKTLEQDIFKLINSVVKKDLQQSFEILEDMFRQGESSIKIINLIARQFRIIFQVRELNGQGLSKVEMGSKLKISPYVIGLSLDMIDSYQSKELLSILSKLSELDYQIKIGQLPKEIALETFITQVS
ncbi:DNA polymerase III subunit delta [Metabacillus fastidiosus]|uniref:DNA polymerase III subunit delta n=1 Tax=Metabacillus fastidiosus TaxID=1458 RepID=A0ABU6P400_9BACI|nr:DNA polymerase III subunit delta [Metabacillus fastidiosus]MED4404085.1 DNA polymerase III subunit delta [Metabacillus fastidiosus]